MKDEAISFANILLILHNPLFLYTRYILWIDNIIILHNNNNHCNYIGAFHNGPD